MVFQLNQRPLHRYPALALSEWVWGDHYSLTPYNIGSPNLTLSPVSLSLRFLRYKIEMGLRTREGREKFPKVIHFPGWYLPWIPFFREFIVGVNVRRTFYPPIYQNCHLIPFILYQGKSGKGNPFKLFPNLCLKMGNSKSEQSYFWWLD